MVKKQQQKTNAKEVVHENTAVVTSEDYAHASSLEVARKRSLLMFEQQMLLTIITELERKLVERKADLAYNKAQVEGLGRVIKKRS